MSAPLTTRGCYICKPDDPSADPEGCSDCGREFFTYVAHVAAALSGDCTDECNPGNCEVQHHEEFAIPEDCDA